MLSNAVKIAWKVLARRPFFTAVSLFGVAFTLLVLLVVTAMLDHVFAPHAPESRAERTLGVYGLAMVGETASRTGFPGYPVLRTTLAGLPGAEEVSIVRLQRGVASYVDGRKLELDLKGVDGAFWRIHDFTLLEGRTIDDDDLAAARPVAVINATTRERLFGNDPAVDRWITADGQRFRIVGVVADVPFVRMIPYADLWAPYTVSASDGWRDEPVGSFAGVVLAQDAAAIPALQAEFATRLAALTPPDPKTFARFQGGLETFFEFVSRSLFARQMERAEVGKLRAVLAAAAFLFMLLPAVNLVNLNLSRILERSSEIGVRRAFGAPARALVLQFVVENLVLTLLGAAVGTLLAALVLAGVNASGLVPYAAFSLNLRVLMWGLVLAVGFGLLSGVYPAWRMARLHPVRALRGRSS